MDTKLFLAPGEFIKDLKDQALPSHRRSSVIDEVEVHSIDLTALKIDASHFTPVLVARKLSGLTAVPSDRIEDILPSLKRICGSQQANFAVLLIGGRLQNITPSLRQVCRENAIAVVDRPIMENTRAAITAEQKYQQFSAGLLRFLSLETLSPYKVGEPAWGGRFFGRAQILDRVIAGRRARSFILVGKRRIGKTSLLREIRRRLSLREPGLKATNIIDGSLFDGTEEFLSGIISQLKIGSLDSPTLHQQSVGPRFCRVIHNLAEKQSDGVVLFIDEADRLLELDEIQNWELMDILRATFQHRSCRIFLAGFRRVRAAADKLEHPLHNIGDVVSIGRLERDETLSMIRTPMHTLGIELVGSGLAEVIYRETGGQPELIQIFCSAILEHYSRTNRLPDASELVGDVVEGDFFEKKVLRTFLANASPYEEVLSYLLIDRAVKNGQPVEDFEFTLRDIHEVLAQKGHSLGMEGVTTLASNLKLGGTIVSVPGAGRRYRFAVPQLPRACLDLDLELCIVTALERLERVGHLSGLLGEHEGTSWNSRGQV